MIHGPHHSQSLQGGKVVQDARGDKTQSTPSTRIGDSLGGNAGQASSQQPAPSGAVSLSQEAVMMQKIDQSLSEVDDVDKSKVVAIREQIESGNYIVNSEAVASKMLSLDKLY